MAVDPERLEQQLAEAAQSALDWLTTALHLEPCKVDQALRDVMRDVALAWAAYIAYRDEPDELELAQADYPDDRIEIVPGRRAGDGRLSIHVINGMEGCEFLATPEHVRAIVTKLNAWLANQT